MDELSDDSDSFSDDDQPEEGKEDERGPTIPSFWRRQRKSDWGKGRKTLIVKLMGKKIGLN